MNHTKIESHIDNKIISKISNDNLSLDSVKSDLIDSITKFSGKESFMKVTKFYLLRNWKVMPVKKKYTTYYVIHSIKRLEDIDWLIERKDRFPNLSDLKLFKLIQFKEKIK